MRYNFESYTLLVLKIMWTKVLTDLNSSICWMGYYVYVILMMNRKADYLRKCSLEKKHKNKTSKLVMCSFCKLLREKKEIEI